MTTFFDPGLEKKPDFCPVHEAHLRLVRPRGAGPRAGALLRPQRGIRHGGRPIPLAVSSRTAGTTRPIRWSATWLPWTRAATWARPSRCSGPNLGPNAFAGLLGAKLEFGEVTSWAKPCLTGPEDLKKIAFDPESEYLKKLDELTDCALEACEGKFWWATPTCTPASTARTR